MSPPRQQEDPDGDHYAVLGVARDATRPQVRAAYLAVMRRSHPDRAPGDPRAHARARAATAAWEVLRDPQRRAAYDRALSRRGRPAPRRSPGSPDLLREAAARQAARSARADTLREAFHRASLRIGVTVLLLGTVLLFALGVP